MELTMREEHKVAVAEAVMDGRLAMDQAAQALERTERSVYRLLRRVREQGPAGVVHGNRGRTSPRRTPDFIRTQVLSLAQGRYRDVNDTHLQELLALHDNIILGRETLRAMLRQADLAPKSQRHAKKHRRRRARKESFGTLLQIDASPHSWLEDRGPCLTLVGAKDDATGYVWARFVEAETTWAYLDLMGDIFLSHGLPLALYSDRHAIFHSPREPTIQEQLQGLAPLTQFARAMDELGITIIKAWSPQAKGRIERQWGVFQDRLVVELRLAQVSTLAAANRLLLGFLPRYNRRFNCAPQNPVSSFRPTPAAARLHRILCLKETRTVKKDHTISFEGLVLQLPPVKKYPLLADRKVDVLQLQDGSLEVLYRDHLIATFSQQTVSRMVKSNPNLKTNLRAA